MKLPDDVLIELYGTDELDAQQRRYRDLVREYSTRFGKPRSLQFVSAPGRTELGGNHTDHNRGKVLCAAVCRDTVAVVEPRSDTFVKLKSSAFPGLYDINLANLEPRQIERSTADALIRGVAAGLEMRGYKTGGFNAVVHSDVGIGSGLSSSASFEVLIGGIFNTLFNDVSIDPVALAQIGQYAENEYFGKPCGLMDQLASAVGGVLSIDFEDAEIPIVEKIPMDFSETNFVLAVVDTGGSHANLVSAYASIPGEMHQAAILLGKHALRQVREEAFLSRMRVVRENAGDRAVLRALHFFAENRRVGEMVEALKAGDFDAYLRLVSDSGASSTGMLQNTVPPVGEGNEQPAALAIGVSNDFFRSKGCGVARIHGGGFAGTIQAYIHKDHFKDYARLMGDLFGEGSVQPLKIRSQGVMGIQQIPA